MEQQIIMKVFRMSFIHHDYEMSGKKIIKIKCMKLVVRHARVRNLL